MSAVVLMYHRIAPPGVDPYGLAVHPERFAEHVALLSRLAVVPLAEVLHTTGVGTRFAITFDDGYADNATTAAPLLAAAGLPVTFFITTGTLGGRRFWWDRLADAVLRSDRPRGGVDVTVGGRELWLSLRDDVARDASLRFLHRRLRPLPPEELADTAEDVLAALGSTAPASPDVEDGRSMTEQQLRELGASPLVDIGGHTRTHLQLAGQRERLQREEIAGSVADLRALGLSVTTFAYPFGTPGAVGARAARLVREAGCELACSTDPGAVTRRSDRFALPRLNVRDWPAERLERSLRELAAER